MIQFHSECEREVSCQMHEKWDQFQIVGEIFYVSKVVLPVEKGGLRYASLPFQQMIKDEIQQVFLEYHDLKAEDWRIIIKDHLEQELKEKLEGEKINNAKDEKNGKKKNKKLRKKMKREVDHEEVDNFLRMRLNFTALLKNTQLMEKEKSKM